MQCDNHNGAVQVQSCSDMLLPQLIVDHSRLDSGTMRETRAGGEVDVQFISQDLDNMLDTGDSL